MKRFCIKKDTEVFINDNVDGALTTFSPVKMLEDYYFTNEDIIDDDIFYTKVKIRGYMVNVKSNDIYGVLLVDRNTMKYFTTTSANTIGCSGSYISTIP